MGSKVLCLSVALLQYLMICKHVRAQCTQPSFESKNVVLSDSHLSTQSFPDGSSVTFECEIGHRPVNSRASKSVTCQGTQWTSLDLECTRKSCGSPPDFFHGRYEKTGILFGDKITAVCDKGYMLAGQIKDRWCRDQGWDGRDPVCEVVKCLAPPAIENGQLGEELLDSYDYNRVVSYKCNHGFSLTGDSTLRCSQDGTFKPDPPKCLALPPTTTAPKATSKDPTSTIPNDAAERAILETLEKMDMKINHLTSLVQTLVGNRCFLPQIQNDEEDGVRLGETGKLEERETLFENKGN